MSLDLSFNRVREVEEASFNITHNLNKMAEALGVYKILWRPEEFPGKKAADFLPEINTAIQELTTNGEAYKKYEAENGWGKTENFLRFLKEVRNACEEFPDSTLQACR